MFVHVCMCVHVHVCVSLSLPLWPLPLCISAFCLLHPLCLTLWLGPFFAACLSGPRSDRSLSWVPLRSWEHPPPCLSPHLVPVPPLPAPVTISDPLPGGWDRPSPHSHCSTPVSSSAPFSPRPGDLHLQLSDPKVAGSTTHGPGHIPRWSWGTERSEKRQVDQNFPLVWPQ